MLNLVLYPDPVLSKVAEPVTEFNDELKETVKEMFRIMRESNGIGLAAPQVGLSKRIFVTEVDRISIPFINPEIVESYGESSLEEGCLSFPGIQVRVIRKGMITVKAQRLDGTLFNMTITGLASICFQHELDHLNGINFIDSLPNTVKSYIIRRLEREKKNREQQGS